MTKILVLYYSTYGTTKAMADIAAASLEGQDVRLRRVAETAPQEIIDSQDAWKNQQMAQASIPVVTPEDMDWSDGIIFAFPTRFGNIPSQAQAFFDTLGGLWFEGKLANKAVTAMVAAGNTHGGQESTLLTLYKSLMHWGAIIVPPGYTDQALFAAGGNPYGTSQTGADISDETKAAIKIQAKRLAEMTQKLTA